MKKFFLLFCVGMALGLPFVVYAGPFSDAINKLDQAVGPNSGTGLPDDVTSVAGTIVKTALSLVGTIFFLLTIYAGILWMTAGGEEENITKATSILKAAIIGLIITLSAYAITIFVTSRIGQQSQSTTAKSCAESGGTCQATCAKPIIPNTVCQESTYCCPP